MREAFEILWIPLRDWIVPEICECLVQTQPMQDSCRSNGKPKSKVHRSRVLNGSRLPYMSMQDGLFTLRWPKPIDLHKTIWYFSNLPVRDALLILLLVHVRYRSISQIERHGGRTSIWQRQWQRTCSKICPQRGSSTWRTTHCQGASWYSGGRTSNPPPFLRAPFRQLSSTFSILLTLVPKSYSDFPQNKFNSGHGFIVPHDKVSHGAPERYIFHKRSIQTPNKAGGIEPRTRVTFSIISSHSGTRSRAVAVTTTCPPEEYNDWIFINTSFDDFEEEYGNSPEALKAAEADENRNAGQEIIYTFIKDESWV